MLVLRPIDSREGACAPKLVDKLKTQDEPPVPLCRFPFIDVLEDTGGR
ncbi:hypothetical protein [Rhodopirellula halodulae]|nr:hypothetical protein [Rhodopirellula sp. JC737]MCC9658528.1 hypothetical protein [Rhodopirellula sp. JC737]